MRFGMCAGADKAESFARMGYDYLEISVGSFSGLSEADFEKLEKSVAAGPIPVEAVNCFFPGHIRLTGEGFEAALIAAHAAKVMERAERLGVKIAVVGSGGARKVPDGFDVVRARAQFAEALRLVGDAALRHGVTAVIEPLNKGETNLVNSYRDGVHLAAELSHPGVASLIDFYHMAVENEPAETVLTHPRLLRHVHIANPTGRVFPARADEAAYADFFSKLAQVGYQGRMSVEAGTKNPDVDGPAALAVMRRLAAQAAKQPVHA